MDDEFLELTLQYAGQILKVRPQLQPVAFSDFLGTLQCLKPFLECALEKSAIPHEMRALFRKCTLVQVDAALLEKIFLPAKSNDGAYKLGNDEDAGKLGYGDTG